MARLRAMKGVSKIALATSEKSDAATNATSGSASGGSPSTDCTQSGAGRPKFNMVIFYGEGDAQAATTDAAAGDASASAAAAPASATPASGGAQ